MLDLANIFIVILAAGAVWLGVAAVVRKRTARRRKDRDSSTNAAS
jgi:hypothetical protein